MRLILRALVVYCLMATPAISKISGPFDRFFNLDKSQLTRCYLNDNGHRGRAIYDNLNSEYATFDKKFKSGGGKDAEIEGYLVRLEKLKPLIASAVSGTCITTPKPRFKPKHTDIVRVLLAPGTPLITFCYLKSKSTTAKIVLSDITRAINYASKEHGQVSDPDKAKQYIQQLHALRGAVKAASAARSCKRKYVPFAPVHAAIIGTLLTTLETNPGLITYCFLKSRDENSDHVLGLTKQAKINANNQRPKVENQNQIDAYIQKLRELASRVNKASAANTPVSARPCERQIPVLPLGGDPNLTTNQIPPGAPGLTNYSRLKSIPVRRQNIPAPNEDKSAFLIEDQYLVALSPSVFPPIGIDFAQATKAQIAAFLPISAASILKIYNFKTPLILVAATRETSEILRRNAVVLTVAQDKVAFLLGENAASPDADFQWSLNGVINNSSFPGLSLESTAMQKQVRVYVVDSGIKADHPQLLGKVLLSIGLTIPLGGLDEDTCNNHGTGVASLIVGSNTGLNNNVELIDVVVVPCTADQRFPASNMLDALQWISEFEESDYVEQNPMETVVNMSMGALADWYLADDPDSREGGQMEKIFGEIITDYQLPIVVSAGNEARDACIFFPALLPETITVGAHNSDGAVSGYSNRGDCVDVYAPGDNVPVAAAQSNQFGMQKMEGTSPATAIVSGFVVHMLGQNFGIEKTRANLEIKKRQALPGGVIQHLLRGQTGDNQGALQSGGTARQDFDPFCTVYTDRPKIAVIGFDNGSRKVLGYVQNGDQVEYLAIDGDWVKIRWTSALQSDGWVKIGRHPRSYLGTNTADRICKYKS